MSSAVRLGSFVELVICKRLRRGAKTADNGAKCRGDNQKRKDVGHGSRFGVLGALHPFGFVWVTRSCNCSRERLLVACAGVLLSAPHQYNTTMVNPCQHMRWTRLRLMPRCSAMRRWVQPWRRKWRMRCCCVCVTHSRMTIGRVSKTATHTRMQVMIQVVMVAPLATAQGLVNST